MSTFGWGLAFVVVVMLSPLTASAESKEELVKSFEAYVDFVPDPSKYTTARELGYPAETYACRELVRRATAALAPEDELTSLRFGGQPDARRVGDQWAVKVSDLWRVCSVVGARVDKARLIGMIALSKQWEALLARGFTDDDRSRLTAVDAQWADAVTRECDQIVFQMTNALEMDAADGKRDGKLDGSVEINYAWLSLADARPCEAMKKWNDLYQAEWKTRRAVIAKPFEDAGIGGERLETLLSKAPALYYAPDVDGWVIEGCKRAKTIKQLKKAKELVYVQATRDNQVLLIRFRFKGDATVARTNKVFPTVKAAFKTRCRV